LNEARNQLLVAGFLRFCPVVALQASENLGKEFPEAQARKFLTLIMIIDK
jgi:hypothetical protein